MSVRLLAVGDLHLGRLPTRLPLTGADELARYGPEAALESCVRAAVEHAVHAVVFVGDVVEDTRDFFEGYRVLARACEQLHERGIRVIGVAGNHDSQVLPHLAAKIKPFELLGADGLWTRTRIEAGASSVTLHGWSFPQPHYPGNPLDAFPRPDVDGPHLGVLHCDRDVRESRYAPVRRTDLDRAGVDAWLLGHVHVPDPLHQAPEPGRPAGGYLGNVTGLHPGDTGLRGPWLVQVAPGEGIRFQQIPLAPLLWAHETVDLTDVTDLESVRSRTLSRVQRLEAQFARQGAEAALIGIRLHLHGRSPLTRKEIDDAFDEETRARLFRGTRATCFIERLRAEPLPERPLEVLAERGDPVGLVAQRLQTLQRPPDDPERQRLIAGARDHLDPVYERSTWQGLLSTEPEDDEAVAQRLSRTARDVLETLLAQEEAP